MKTKKMTRTWTGVGLGMAEIRKGQDAWYLYFSELSVAFDYLPFVSWSIFEPLMVVAVGYWKVLKKGVLKVLYV